MTFAHVVELHSRLWRWDRCSLQSVLAAAYILVTSAPTPPPRDFADFIEQVPCRQQLQVLLYRVLITDGKKHSSPFVSCVLIREKRRQQIEQTDYTIRVSYREREKCDTVRATFVVKMPDFLNPNAEFWVLTFCCDLHRFEDDMESITSCCFPEMCDAASASIRAVVRGLLEAMEKDLSSVPVEKDFCFYPKCSADLIDIIGKDTVPNVPKVEDCSPSDSEDESDEEGEELITVRVPVHALPVFHRLAKYLEEKNNTDPVIIIPSSTKNSGHLLFLPNHPSFLCSWDSFECGFGLYFLPNYNNFIIVQGRNSLGPQTTIYYPPKSGLLAITPTTEVAHIEKLAIVHPKNLSMPLLELPLSEFPSTPVNCDDLISLVMTLRESLADPKTALPDENSWKMSESANDCPIKCEVSSGAAPFWNQIDATARQIAWSIRSVGAKHLSSIRGFVSAPLISSDQDVPTKGRQAQAQFPVIRLPENEENNNLGLHPDLAEEAKDSEPSIIATPTETAARTDIATPVQSLTSGSGQTPRLQTQSKSVSSRSSNACLSLLPFPLS
ncbi:unnamed protein product [Hydatigera taeniaeformis]|uniref:Uncharacterized protein n=1 Tax=Hydatigena taeniaeformis TaxID=6205 RepID=A0A3P7HBE1_HYDTA|nr:unnamed protein product [Hydatigera taeniaeformis]